MRGEIGFAIHEGCFDFGGNVDRGVRGGVDGPILIVLQVEEITAVRARFQLAIFDEAIVNLRAGAGGRIDQINVGGGAANGAFESVLFPVGCPGEGLMAEGRDGLIEQAMAELGEGAGIEMPGGEHGAVGIATSTEFLVRHHFGVAPVPDADGGWFVFLFVFLLYGVFLFGGRFVTPIVEAEEDGLGVVGPGRCVGGSDSNTSGERRAGGGWIEAMSGFGGLREMSESDGDVCSALVFVVGFGAEKGEIVAVFAPSQAAVGSGGGV